MFDFWILIETYFVVSLETFSSMLL